MSAGSSGSSPGVLHPLRRGQRGDHPGFAGISEARAGVSLLSRLSISAVVMSYLQNPQPMSPPW